MTTCRPIWIRWGSRNCRWIAIPPKCDAGRYDVADLGFRCRTVRARCRRLVTPDGFRLVFGLGLFNRYEDRAR